MNMCLIKNKAALGNFIKNYKNIIFCCFTGLMAVGSFPKFSYSFLIWIAFIPFIFVVTENSFKKSFFYGFIAGFTFNALGLYWLVPMLELNMGSYVQTIISSCCLWAYLSLYWGAWALFFSFIYINTRKIKNRIFANSITIIVGSCLWVLLEYIRTYFLTGFPWMLVGYSQFKFIEIIQLSEICGVYGISFLILFCNLCFYFWIKENQKKYLYLALFFILIVLVFGVIRAEKFNFFGQEEFSVSIVQPNIDQNRKWDDAYKEQISDILNKFAIKISENKTDLVIWPETVLPGYVPIDKYIYDNAKYMVNIAGGFNIVGSNFFEKDLPYNATFAFEDNGDYVFVHKKNHLVPFGEFIPYKSFLSRFFGVLNQMGDFVGGEDTQVFNNGKIYLGSTICSENFFPDISRRFVLSRAKVLVNQANDAWFFDTAALEQHFIMNVFRAVENRKSMLISANSGISGIIDASGFIVSQTVPSKRALLRGTFLQNDFLTFYTKRGDIFVYVCMSISLATFFIVLILYFSKIFYKKIKRGLVC
ncbi:MAG: apolipoprotein N-acyltransferase [Endomicrobium sp.]|jgi:apolipoprotein N-acyltransferase|nr:apolipoprotein N-acyltransferase [Endomicrobium sp.]